LMIPSSMIELGKLLDRYPTSAPNSFWLKNLFLVALEQLRFSRSNTGFWRQHAWSRLWGQINTF
jgi:hypothetical protein